MPDKTKSNNMVIGGQTIKAGEQKVVEVDVTAKR